MKDFFLLLLLSFSSLCWGNSESNLSLSFNYGFQNRLCNASLVPVNITIRNEGKKPIAGVLRVYQSNNIFQSPPCSYEKRVSLPAPSTKFFEFYLPLIPQQLLSVEFSSSEGVLLKESKDLDVYMDPLLVSVYGKEEEGKTFGIYSEPQASYKLAEATIGARRFPSKYMGLDGVDFILLAEPEKITFTSSQQEALLTWVSLGGTLILANGDFLGERVFDVLRKNFSHSLSSKNGKNYYQRGQVAVMRQSSDSSSFVHSMRRLIRPEKNKADIWEERSYFRDDLRKELEGTPEYSWMIFLFIAYVLCIGPVDYYICKKLKSPALTWIIFIVMIALFTFLAYLKGYWLKSGELKMSSIHCLDVLPSQTTAQGNSFFGFYSPRNTTYEVFAKKRVTFLFPLLTSQTDESYFPPTSILQEGEKQILRVRLPIYSSSTYLGRFTMDNPLGEREKTLFRLKKNRSSGELQLFVPEEDYLTSYIITKNASYEILAKTEKLWDAKKIANTPFIPQHYKGEDFSYRLSFLSAYSFRENTYNQESPSFQEKFFDWSKFLEQGYAIAFIFLKTPLNFIEIANEFPQRREINVIRVLVPIEFIN